VHPRYRTPATSIIAQAVWSALLVLSGSAEALTRYTGFAVVLFAGVAVVSLFMLRQREPDAPRPFQAWGYPIAPAIFAVASLAIVLNALWADLVTPIQTGAPWGPAAKGLIIIGLGVPLYYVFSRRK
jgi:APA family basic amino acid/polyamine antiporter